MTDILHLDSDDILLIHVTDEVTLDDAQRIINSYSKILPQVKMMIVQDRYINGFTVVKQKEEEEDDYLY